MNNETKAMNNIDYLDPADVAAAVELLLTERDEARRGPNYWGDEWEKAYLENQKLREEIVLLHAQLVEKLT